jgi:serine/threonine-protein kinase RsbT
MAVPILKHAPVSHIQVGAAVRVPIQSFADIVMARQECRRMASALGVPNATLTVMTAAISEVARNIVEHAKEGEISITPIGRGALRGLQIVARDRGPGIVDLDTAMRDGYSTNRSLGIGLPGARRLMDQFDISSVVGQGTTITMTKWIG